MEEHMSVAGKVKCIHQTVYNIKFKEVEDLVSLGDAFLNLELGHLPL